MQKVKCVHGKFGRYDCEHCIREEAELMYLDREIEELAEIDRLIRSGRCATDREWEEHLASCGYGEPCGDIEETWVGVEVTFG